MKKTLLKERFQQLAGIKPLYTEQSDTDDYGRSISGKDKRTFVDPKDLMPAARAKKMAGMDDNKIELEDLDFETLKSFFPKFYQKVRFTRPQPSGEEGPYYEDAISFPNADDSQTVIGDESSLEDWKAKTLKRFGNVEMEFNNEAKNWFDRVKVNNDAFGDAKSGFAKGKQDFIDKERELGRSID